MMSVSPSDEREMEEALERMRNIGRQQSTNASTPSFRQFIAFAIGEVERLDRQTRKHDRDNPECETQCVVLLKNVADAVTKTIEEFG